MTKLSKIRADKLSDAIAVVEPLFERARRIIQSHSQPLETLNVRPTLAELKSDWQSLLNARDAYLS